MKIITEKEILKMIRKLSKSTKEIPVTCSLQKNRILSYEDITELLSEISREYSITADMKDSNGDMPDTVMDIVNIVNEKLGFHRADIRFMLEDICCRNSERTALIFDRVLLTYGDLLSKTKKLAAGLAGFKIRKGTHVGIILDNCLEYIIVYFALFYIGAIPVPINTRWTKHEIEKVLTDSKARYLIVQERSGKTIFSEAVLSMMDTGYEIDTVFYKGENFYGEKGYPLESLEADDENLPLEEIAGDDEAMISYTSGTTGTPKGVVLRHNDIVKISVYTSRLILEDDTSLSIAPLYSAQGFLSLFINFASESRFKMLSSFNPNDILKEITKGEDSIIHTQPTMWTLLLNCRNIKFAKFDKLKNLVVSGSLCAPELAKRIENRLGCTLFNVYGLIEATSVVTMTRKEDPDEIRYNTVGRPIPGVSIKIVDENRNTVPKGEIGELAVKGYVMKEYYNKPEITNRVVDQEGWLYTGDLAKYYDEENISIVGRCKDMVIRGGFNVYPSDIEEVLMQIPEIQTAAVIGRPNDILGEELVAFVVPRAGIKIDKYAISRYLFANISNYKQPDFIYLINDMPILLAGKIDKKQLYVWATKGIPDDKKILFD